MLHNTDNARCATCDRATERNGVLAHRLRKTIAALHLRDHHHGEWSSCPEPACVAVWEALEARPAPHKRAAA